MATFGYCLVCVSVHILFIKETRTWDKGVFLIKSSLQSLPTESVIAHSLMVENADIYT
jgi:hypothetical protein